MKLCEQSRKLGTIIKKQNFDGLFMLHSSLHFLQPCSQQSESRDRLSTRGLSFKRQFKSFLYLTNCFSRNLLKLESVKRNGSCLLLQTALKWFNINIMLCNFKQRFFCYVFNKKLPRISMLFIIAFQNIEPGSIWEQERFYKKRTRRNDN